MTQQLEVARADELDAIARRLSASGDYKVLRRLVPRPLSPALADGSEKIGIVIDLETTGLDHSKDEALELAMVKFRFVDSGVITGVSDIFRALQQPSIPIPAEVTRLTGISDAIVAGQTIETVAIENFIGEADHIIAHHASFDRAFAERLAPGFVHKAWSCSATEVRWKDYGFSSAKLTHLAAESGFFYEAHRAENDCHAVLELLSRPLPGTSTTALTVLLRRAARKTCRIWAEYAPFDLKHLLKARGYRWSNGENGSLRCWYIDIDEASREAELRFLREEIYRRDVGLRCIEYTALDRFSGRMDVHC